MVQYKFSTVNTIRPSDCVPPQFPISSSELKKKIWRCLTSNLYQLVQALHWHFMFKESKIFKTNTFLSVWTIPSMEIYSRFLLYYFLHFSKIQPETFDILRNSEIFETFSPWNPWKLGHLIVTVNLTLEKYHDYISPCFLFAKQ